METVDPRVVLKHCFHILSMYPDDALRIIVYTGAPELNIRFVEMDIIYINKINGEFRVFSELKPENVMLINLNEIFEYLENKPITLIELENPLEEDDGESMVIYRCRTNECQDVKHWASTVIQQKFRESRDYNEWKWSPERMKDSGEFNNLSFGKVSELSYLQRLI